MNKLVLIAMNTLCVLEIAARKPALAQGYWQQFVHYSIEAQLNTRTQIIQAQQTLLYQNNSPDTLTHLYFHLYPNAFQPGSIMDQESRVAGLKLIRSDANCGWLKIDSLAIRRSSIGSTNIAIDSLTDATILKIGISPPMLPNEQLHISFKFRTKIRLINYAGGKGGYLGNSYEITQWYPKICVYDDHGWNAEPYHWLGEFYGEIGTFDVTLETPREFIIAAAGELTAGDPGWQQVAIDSTGQADSFLLSLSENDHSPLPEHDDRRTATFHAENVHDFAWLANPDFVFQTANWNNVTIRLLFPKQSLPRWKRAMNDTKLVLSWLQHKIGEFPYPSLTIVQGLTQGGMEYPMMAILGHFDSILLAHEIGHCYFYAALANNEQTEAWLDEGITTYLGELFTQQYFPERNRAIAPVLDIAGLKRQFPACSPQAIQLNSLYSYFYSGFDLPLSTPAFELKNLYRYSYNVYVKPTRFFAMLEYMVGLENFTTILQTYYQRWKYKHVNGQRLQAICEQVAQQDLDWFFQQWLHDTPRIDYACAKVASHQINEHAWTTEVVVQRLGNGIAPFDAMIVTENGETFKQRWFGQAPMNVYRLTTQSKVKAVQLDPDDVILDQNRLNNGRFRVRAYLYPDFPSMYYLPREAYTVFSWPLAWYNDVDGFKIGLKVLGGYLNRYYITRNYLWYGVKSRELDFNFGYSTPMEFINRNLWGHLSAIKFEGRSELQLSFNYNFYEQFASPRLWAFYFGFIHQQLFDANYAFRRYEINDRKIKICEWDRGNVNRFYLSYRSNCSHLVPESSVEIIGQIADRLWQSDYNYHRLSLEYKFQLGQQLKHWRFGVRTFAGYCSAAPEHLPRQLRFWLAEANPQQRFRYFYLTSIGAMPPEAHYHFPGDGNLRGYLTKVIAETTPLTAGSLLTTNVEILYRNAHTVLPRAIERWFQGITLALFLDAGRTWNSPINERFLVDAGVGVRFYHKFLGRQQTLRIDFPFWLSHPNLSPSSPTESPWKFRWLLSLQ